jgi:hypothetical protein
VTAGQQQQQTVGIIGSAIDFDRFEEMINGGTPETLMDLGLAGVTLVRHPEHGVVILLNTAGGKFGMVSGFGLQ